MAGVGKQAVAKEKHKIFLSMSFIGNDWQAEAANMVKAMAAHKSLADKVDLRVQVAGPNAQRQIQQINAMVQAGADAIVTFPISPTALNSVVTLSTMFILRGVTLLVMDKPGGFVAPSLGNFYVGDALIGDPMLLPKG